MTDAPTAQGSRPADPAHNPPPGARPPLRRSREHKVLSGVCGGLGRCFDLDPVVFRVVLGVLGVTGGLGLIVYGLAWLLVPLEGEEENEARRMLSGRVEGPALTALLCALVGCGLFLSMLNNSGAMAFSLALAIAVVGAAYWSQHHRHADGEEDAPATQKTVEAPPETKAPPTPGTPSWWRDPLVKDGMTGPAAAGTGYLWGPDDALGADPAHGHGRYGGHGPFDGLYEPKTAAARPPFPVARPAPQPAGRALGGWVFLLALAAFALGTGLTWHDRPVGTSLEIGLACALGVFGLGIATSALYGRTGGGTVFAAMLTGVLLTGAAALPESVTADWTRKTWRPANAAEVRDHYAVGSGVGVLDLSGVAWPKDKVIGTSAGAGAGQLKVVVPPDVTARLDVKVGLGDIQLPGEQRDDIDISPGQRKRITLPPPAGHASRGTLEIRLEVGIGQVEVTRATP
ncbi:PspC domain-containing protein [Streptomyces netropsis]|uniref:Phage shock protein PspC (Stress-responsive transcriptional regulator) n=1 Tax=Streptomyces netropsis TaxID=55404 RepID=A0A7W7LFI4_STRNE|nr:PspC domain-containing protein [Streptomyces netropsis]MBB4888761.1 phage shock protein PspC (stress-responsive transcriptional regulator) [Streptomyces netropsis]GGR14894.1 membrane protein [Streptomyces netropsis]